MSNKTVGFKHLVSRIPNTEDNRNIIKEVNKLMKSSNSLYRLSIRYRTPKDGHKYGYGGNLKCENANTFSVYIDFGVGLISSDTEYYQKRTGELAREVNSLSTKLNKI